MDKGAFEQYLYANIPLSQAMGVKVVELSTQNVLLEAPFGPNINHKSTVFGASLNALATLACWSLVRCNLDLLPGRYEIVIAESDARFLKPVRGAFRAECRRRHPEEWERFMMLLERKGRGRIRLEAAVEDKFLFSGSFVAFLGLCPKPQQGGLPPCIPI